MRSVSFSLVLLLGLPACGSDHAGSGSTPSSSTSQPSTFNPPAAPDGYQRVVMETVHDIAPGDDVTQCQYVMPAFDHDVDVLDVRGYQSKFGHHAIAFSFTPTGNEVMGDTFPCMGNEVSSGLGPDGGAASGGLSAQGAFLGGPAGQADRQAERLLPDGVAFRLKKGQGVTANIHFINTGLETIDGNAVLDFSFADPDPSRHIAGMYIDIAFGFDILPQAKTNTSVECTVGSDVQLLMLANHMHEYGSTATTEVVRGDTGALEVVHNDPQWTADMQFNLVFSKWTLDAPFVLHKGDTVRTRCTWDNETANPLAFPREMCVGVGFALTSADSPSPPSCMNGTWMDHML